MYPQILHSNAIWVIVFTNPNLHEKWGKIFARFFLAPGKKGFALNQFDLQ